MPSDLLKTLDAVRKEAAQNEPNMAQTLALQRIAASLECIRVELLQLSSMLSRQRPGGSP